MKRLATFAMVGGMLVLVSQSPACDLCPGAQSAIPLSAELAAHEMVVFGPIVRSKLSSDGLGGTSELRIDEALKLPDEFKGRTTITLNKYAPPDPKVKYLVFVDVVQGQMDPYRATPYSSDRIVKYLRNAPAWIERGTRPEARAERLQYYFPFLNDPEPEIANDAYKEWATASNREVGLAAPRVSAAELRSWLMDKKSPPQRLSLYAYLLGACGGDRDAALLRAMILNPDERAATALDGLLAGYVHLRPEDGWQLTQAVIADPKRPFTQKHAVLRMLRFHLGYQPEESRKQVLACAALLLKQPDVNDLAVEQLRNWKLWEHTDQVLSLYGAKDADAPMTRRAIVRYALTCPLPAAKRFVEALRKKDAMLVSEIEEALAGQR